MASGINKVILIGRLGKDPEVRYNEAGGAVANFSIATSESWKDKAGEKHERTEWHRVVVWGKLGELCGQYLTKGRQVFVEGRLQTRSWEKDGEKRYSTEVVAQNIQFLGDVEKGAQPAHKPASAKPVTAQGGDFAWGPSDDEVPF